MAVDHLAHLRADADRIAAVLAQEPLDREVVSCPGWDLRRLGAHVGVVHRWATQAVLTGEAPSARPLDPDDDADLVAWFREGADALVQALATTDPDRPTWHPFPAPKVVATWRRRQAHETSIHRWDAQAAAGTPDPIDADLASDGVDEYLSIMLPRKLQREGLTVPSSTLHVHCTDVPGEWLIGPQGSTVSVERVHAKGDAALRGPAEALLLALWGRRRDDTGNLSGGEVGGDTDEMSDYEVIGDPSAADAWLAIGGN